MDERKLHCCEQKSAEKDQTTKNELDLIVFKFENGLVTKFSTSHGRIELDS